MQVKNALNWKIFVLLLCDIYQRYQKVLYIRSNTNYSIRTLTEVLADDRTICAIVLLTLIPTQFQMQNVLDRLLVRYIFLFCGK